MVKEIKFKGFKAYPVKHIGGKYITWKFTIPKQYIIDGLIKPDHKYKITMKEVQ